MASGAPLPCPKHPCATTSISERIPAMSHSAFRTSSYRSARICGSSECKADDPAKVSRRFRVHADHSGHLSRCPLGSGILGRARLSRFIRPEHGPIGKVTETKEPPGKPSRSEWITALTRSPTFSDERLQPSWMRLFGLPISTAQISSTPEASIILSLQEECGLVQLNSVTKPVIVCNFVMSNMAPEWCADTALDKASNRAADRTVRMIDIVVHPWGCVAVPIYCGCGRLLGPPRPLGSPNSPISEGRRHKKAPVARTTRIGSSRGSRQRRRGPCSV